MKLAYTDGDWERDAVDVANSSTAHSLKLTAQPSRGL